MKARALSILLLVAGCGDNGVSNGGTDMAVGGGGMDGGGGHDMAVAVTCDPFKQNCANAADKCQIEITTDASGMSSVVNTCLANGTVDEGQTCTRSDPASISDDNCKAGLACTGRGQANNTVCRKICKVDTDCPTNQKCTGYSSMVTSGLCSPTCTLFGSDCTGGLNCNSIYTGPGQSMTAILLCGGVGTGMINDSCMAATDCAANLTCLPISMTAAQCAAFCDDNHPCPASSADGGAAGDGGTLSCDTQALGISLPNNGGVCD